jgi:hypothetical protein
VEAGAFFAEFFAMSGVVLLLCGMYGMIITRDLENDPSESRQAYKYGFRRGARVAIGLCPAFLLVALIFAIFGV